MEREKQIELERDLIEIFNEEYEKRHLITPTNTAEKLTAKGYRKERQGEWLRKDGFFVCSECDSTKPFAVIKDEIHYFGCDYCNNCGAKMKGAE